MPRIPRRQHNHRPEYKHLFTIIDNTRNVGSEGKTMDSYSVLVNMDRWGEFVAETLNIILEGVERG